MRFVGCGLAVAMSMALVACASNEPLRGTSEGIALTIEDDEDALEDAIERAGEHCEGHQRFAVLQAVSAVGRDRRLATFNCVRVRGGGAAVRVRADEDLDDAAERAERYCDRFGREPVLQSVGEIGRSRVAAFNCV
ncbi:MAG TPA: hypothetical protein VFG47_22415 [Geminicoccaceae bacterium]|nr:hypothetical protein [Geminicoccaceae bacterium]